MWQFASIAKCCDEAVPSRLIVFLVVLVPAAHGSQRIVDAEPADGISGLSGHGQLGGDDASCLFCASDDIAFVGCELHLKGVGYVVVH
jgi:hypothetical protein